MTYGNKVYCKFWKRCENGKGCDKALTEEIKHGFIAKEIAVIQFVNEPECFKIKNLVDSSL